MLKDKGEEALEKLVNDAKLFCTIAQLQAAVAAAKRQYGLIRKRYPELNAFLVMSLPGGQTDIDSPPTQIIRDCPVMVVDDQTKADALDVLFHLRELELEGITSPAKERMLKEKLNQLASNFTYDERCQVEIRFNNLKYDLVWKLQVDDLVDRSLTPRSKASIQIVLGTLSQFKGRN